MSDFPDLVSAECVLCGEQYEEDLGYSAIPGSGDWLFCNRCSGLVFRNLEDEVRRGPGLLRIVAGTLVDMQSTVVRHMDDETLHDFHRVRDGDYQDGLEAGYRACTRVMFSEEAWSLIDDALNRYRSRRFKRGRQLRIDNGDEIDLDNVPF